MEQTTRSEEKGDDIRGPLSGIRVVDASTLIAGATTATLLGDFGADVIKVEHPRGDSLRTLGWSRNGASLWWSVMSRNKRCVTLDLKADDGVPLFKRLVNSADVLIENFRPGTLERWGYSYESFAESNPGLVMLRVSGFGQTGPYRKRPGYGTLAEAYSGFAHITGQPDGPPTLPPFALGDGIAGVFGAFACMTALHERDRHPGHLGQVVDLSIYEPLFWLLGPQVAVFDQLGISQTRSGNRAPFTAPRNLYLSADNVWLALSASSQSVAERVMRLIGRPDIIEEDWFQSHEGRLDHVDFLDSLIQGWIGEHKADTVVSSFEKAEAAIMPVLSVEDILRDKHYAARENVLSVPDEQLGNISMQGVVPKLSRTPGRVRFAGPAKGAHNAEVYGDLDWDADSLQQLREKGVI